MSLEAIDRAALDRSGYVMPGESKNLTVTPYFRYESILNEPQSKIQGKPVFDLAEVVELRLAANSNYKPVFLVTEMCEADENTGRVITWAERYKAQYQAFLAGSEQEAEGTPLEELLTYGISQAQLSLCRALNIYSIEALANIEGPGMKKLGVQGNTIKPMAQRYLADRTDGRSQEREIAELRRQIEMLKASSAPVPEPEIAPVPDILPADGDSEKVRLKDEIERIAGTRPRGNPSIETLTAMLEEVKKA